MKKTLLALLPAAMLLSCDLFVPPKVECDNIIANISGQMTAVSATTACAFDDAALVTISHSPKVDPTYQTQGSDPQVPSDLTLANVKVEVVGSGAFVCPSSSCVPKSTDTETEVRSDGRGAVTYNVLIPLPVLHGGDTVTVTGVEIATETWGPGNTCPITADINLSCQPATTTK